jgi:acetyl-CoA C-acetyltransferase
MSSDAIVIVAAKRTPVGAFQGTLSGASAPHLGAAAIDGAVSACGIDAGDIDRVLMGCVLPAGLGQAPARQAALDAGVPEGVPCVTVNKMCGSGMESIILAHDMIKAGSAGIVVAGGLESMSNAPYMLPKARSGMRMGHQQVLDHMFFDGLQDPYTGEMMGHFAQVTADKYGFSREAMDNYAIESVTRAQRAVSDGTFAGEISPVTIKSRRGETIVDTDETPGTVSVEKIPTLRPAFAKDGTVTAATSSSISDGAAAVVMMTAAEAERRGLTPIAKIVGHSAFAHEPAWFTTAPIYAVKKLHDALGMKPSPSSRWLR